MSNTDQAAQMVELAAMLMPYLRDMATQAEGLVALFRKHGLQPGSEQMLDMLARIVPALESMTDVCAESVPRLRESLDEIERMHGGN